MESVVPAMIEPRTSIPALHFCACTEKEKYSPAVTCHELLDGSGQFRRPLLSGVTVKRRKSWLLAASALASSLLGLSGPALAQCVGTPDNVTCSPGGNPYASGINVDTNDGLGGSPISGSRFSRVSLSPSQLAHPASGAMPSAPLIPRASLRAALTSPSLRMV
jgi:hypothetical protein